MSLMIMNPVARSIHGSTSAPTFDINSIFANGEQGVQLEPWDLTTMFQDSTGTIPVTAVGQPVGLRLDKSKGLEKSLWNSFNFSSSENWVLATGWTIDTEAGVLKATSAANNAVAYYNTTQYPLGTRLEITFTISGLTSGGVYVAVDNGGGSSSTKTANGTYTETITHVVGAGLFRFVTQGDSTSLSIDDVSISIIAGNHAYQTTATKRPIYNGFVDFDGIDDAHNIVFPALGSDVTIARAVPGVGVSILTGQTIGAGTWAFNTDDNGLIIVNRALTPAETAGVTAYLNARI